MRVVLQAVLVAAAVFGLSGTIAAAAPPRPLFASDEMLHLTLRGASSSMSRIVGAPSVPGQLTVQGAAPEVLPVQLSVRGITRRKKQICSFPPLRLVFTDKPGKASLFRGQEQLKLVTHCQSFDSFQQMVLLEYSAYKLYQALTPDSFDVRLALIDYVDSDGKPMTTRLGFFIEDIDDVAKRNGLKRLHHIKSVTVSQLNVEAAARFADFEYLISNNDWSMVANAPGTDCCHNSRLLVAKGATTDIIPVPYDFDYAGLVDAPYAVPPAGFRETSVKTRHYGGFCAHNAQAQAYAATMQARRSELLAVIDQVPQMTDRSRVIAKNYLGEFFERIASGQFAEAQSKTCLP